MLTLRWTDEHPQLICMHFLFRDRPRDHSEVGKKDNTFWLGVYGQRCHATAINHTNTNNVICCIRTSPSGIFHFYFYSYSVKETSWPSENYVRESWMVFWSIFLGFVWSTLTEENTTDQPIRVLVLGCQGSNCLAITESSGSSLKACLVTRTVDSVAELLLTVRVIFTANEFAVPSLASISRRFNYLFINIHCLLLRSFSQSKYHSDRCLDAKTETLLFYEDCL